MWRTSTRSSVIISTSLHSHRIIITNTLSRLLSSDKPHYHYIPAMAPRVQGRKPRYPCTECEKGVISSSKAVDCDYCGQWTHIRCGTGITVAQYELAQQSGAELQFCCSACSPAATFLARSDRDSMVVLPYIFDFLCLSYDQ